MKRFLVSVFVLAFVLLSVGQVSGEGTNRPLAVAIVTSGGGSALVAALVAQAEVALSRESDVAVVDRSTIRKILDEQVLAGAIVDKTVDADQALRLGKILKADLFAVIDMGSPAAQGANGGASEQPDDLPLLSLVVFDVSTGRRYWDARLPGKMESAVRALSLAIRESGAKGRNLPADLHTVCVLPVRNLGLPRDMDVFCETLGWLLDRQLTACSRVAVLERGRLEHVMAEQVLSGIETDLRASLLTLEVEASRDESGKGILIKALLRDATGKTHTTVQVLQAVADAQDVADSLMKELQPALGARYEAGKLDRRLEAQRFGRESVAMRRQGALEVAIRAGQAACALDPTDRNLRELAMTQLSVALLSPRTLRSAQLIRAAARNRHEALRHYGVHVPKEQWECNSAIDMNHKFFGAFASVMETWSEAGGEAEEERALAAEDCEAFLEELHKALLDWCMQWTYRDDRGYGGSYTWWFRLPHIGARPFMAAYLKQPAAYNRSCLLSGCHFLDGLARYPDAIAKLSENQVSPEECLLEAAVGLRAEKPGPTPGNLALRKGQVAKMRAHPMAAVRAFAPLAELHDGILEGVDASTREKLLQSVIGEVVALLQKTDVPANQQSLIAMAGIQAIQLAAGRPEDQFVSLTALWETLLTNKATLSRVATLLLQSGQALAEKFQSPGSIARLQSLVQKTLELDDGAGDCTSRDALRGYLEKTKAGNNAVEPKVQEKAPVGAVRDPVTRGSNSPPSNPSAPSSPPWRTLRSLLRFGGEVPGACSYPSLVRNDAVFATVMPDDTHVTALRVPLSGGTATILGTAEKRAKTLITSMDADDVNVYVSTENEVILFPLSGGPVKRFGAGKELPQSAVNGLASVGGELFIGLDNFIIAWRVDTGVFRLVASNRRREPDSPLDDSAAFHVSSMFSDPARQRFVALVIGTLEPSSPVVALGLLGTGTTLDQSVSGIWEYRTETGKFRKLCGRVGLGSRGFRISDREIAWDLSGAGVLAVDLVRDHPWWVGLSANGLRLRNMVATPEMFIVPQELGSVPWLNHDKKPWPPSLAFVGDRMWMCGPFSRLSRQGEMELIPEKEFGEVIALHVLEGGKEILITARNGLWIVTL